VVRNDPGPDHGPASFVTIANSPGMTETALYAFLQTSHRNMPNIRLEPMKSETWLPTSSV
jgi:hypothetical protein